MRHIERYKNARISWLRAAVLGANDGIVSTASLMVGVAAASASQGSNLLTGVAGLAAGGLSMAAGEYVPVHSQAETEQADIAPEAAEIKKDLTAEHNELAAIYVGRGVDDELAKVVAVQHMKHDAIGAHARDELGISDTMNAEPIQAALSSAASFAAGAALPLAVTALVPLGSLIPWVTGTSLVFFALLGALAARAGGANVLTSAWRVTFWGALAMGITAGVGKLFGAVV